MLVTIRVLRYVKNNTTDRARWDRSRLSRSRVRC